MGLSGWDFSEMRRAKYLARTDPALIGDRMPSEIAKILRREAAQQLEVDDDPRLLNFGDVFGNVLVFWQN